MGNKEKGASSERELLHLFWQRGFAVIRAAGSGMLPEPSCDLLVGKGDRKYAIECKTARIDKKYLNKKQIENLKRFAGIFGLKPFVAIKFLRQEWYFISPDKLEKTGKGLAISLEEIKKIGKSFEQFVK